MNSYAPFIGPIKMQDAAVATGNGTAIRCVDGSNGAMTTVTCQVQGTFSATITFEGTVDNTNWVAIGFTSLADGTTTATTATAAGLFRATVLGLQQVRARVSGYVSGTCNVTGIAVG
tara:strand:+ start:2999 stop:3349 length:351 start_codon:yes stop_codon:yes gene_type:complete